MCVWFNETFLYFNHFLTLLGISSRRETNRTVSCFRADSPVDYDLKLGREVLGRVRLNVIMTGYDPSWEDMSNYVVHFTRGGHSEDDYKNIMGIYWDRKLKPKCPFGIGKTKCPEPKSQYAVCFSEIPPGQWGRLKDRRETKYGIGFSKEFVVSQGGGPIWYVWKDTMPWNVLQNMMDKEISNPEADIWGITPFIDAPGKYTSGPYFFDWEREWRHVGSFSFEPDNASFLLIPEKLHSAARAFFEDVRHDNIGPAYLCPYIDPAWEREEILKALDKRI